VVPNCHAKRLPNLTLRGKSKSGALGPVRESLEGTISFDQALAAAGREDGHAEAQTVQVILGSADPNAMQWQSKGDLFYAINWGGVLLCPIGVRDFISPPSSPINRCRKGVWGTVIDAHTGAFIVGGF